MMSSLSSKSRWIKNVMTFSPQAKSSPPCWCPWQSFMSKWEFFYHFPLPIKQHFARSVEKNIFWFTLNENITVWQPWWLPLLITKIIVYHLQYFQNIFCSVSNSIFSIFNIFYFIVCRPRWLPLLHLLISRMLGMTKRSFGLGNCILSIFSWRQIYVFMYVQKDKYVFTRLL